MLFNRIGKLILGGALVLMCHLYSIITAHASSSMSFLRDIEIEDYILEITDPIFKVAGFNPGVMNVYIVNTPDVNAFADHEGRVVIFTGLLLKTKEPMNITGVLAHEIGHLAGKHTVRSMEIGKSLQLAQIAAVAVGAIASVASKNPDAAVGAVMGGTLSATHAFLHHTMQQESAADSFALRYMDALKIPPDGMIGMMSVLRQNERLFHDSNKSPYFRSHPFISERIEFFKNAKKTRASNSNTLSHLKDRHNRVVAKIQAFLEPTDKIKLSTDTMIESYKTAIVLHRQGKSDQAIAILKSLIARTPNDPYLHDLLAQILFESGKVQESVIVYEHLLRIGGTRNLDLVKMSLAKSLLELRDPKSLSRAKTILENINSKEKYHPDLWHLKSNLYGQLNNHGMSSLMLAEESFLLGDFMRAEMQTKAAIAKLPKGSPAYSRALDIKSAISQMPEEEKRTTKTH